MKTKQPYKMIYQFIHVARDASLEVFAGKPVYYIFNNKSNER